MQSLNQERHGVSRRVFAAGCGTLALGGTSMFAPALTRANPAKLVDEYARFDALPRLTARLVAFQVAPVDTASAVVPCQALDLITSQIGPVDFVAFHPAAQTVQRDELEELARKAKEHSCYVAVGVALENHTEWSHALLGPTGHIIGRGLAFEDLVYDTDVGLVALSSRVNPQFESVPDILVHSPSDEGTRLPLGSYTIHLTNHASSSGSAIYAPNGRPMTRAGARWTQGLVARLNLSALRRSRQANNGNQV